MRVSFGQKIDIDYTFTTTPGSGSSNYENSTRINRIRKEKLEPSADKIWGPGNYTMDTYVKKNTSGENGQPPFSTTQTVQILTGQDMMVRKFQELAGLKKNNGECVLGQLYNNDEKAPDYNFEIN